MGEKIIVKWAILAIGFAMIIIGVFFSWHPVIYQPTAAEVQEALKNDENIPRDKIFYYSEPMLIGSMAFDEIEEGPAGELEKVPSLGFCES